MKQTHEQQRSESHSVRHALVLRPLSRALGYSGHLLLCVSSSLLLLTDAQADLGYGCQPGTGTQVCNLSANGALWAPLTLTSDPLVNQTITNTASFEINGAAGSNSIQNIQIGTYEKAVFGGEPLSGIMVVSQGAHGSESSYNGEAAQGAMLTTSGSITLNLTNTTPSGMVTGVGVTVSVGMATTIQTTIKMTVATVETPVLQPSKIRRL